VGISAGDTGQLSVMNRRTRIWARTLQGLIVVALVCSQAPSGSPGPVEAAGPPKSGGTLRIAAAGDVTGLDPAIDSQYLAWIAINHIFEGLYSIDQHGKLRPQLAAAAPQISADGKMYTIRLRQGVKFHNGRELEAADVKYSIERTANPATRSYHQRFTSTIVGFDDVKAGKTTELAGVRVIDKHTVRIELTRPVGVFVKNLSVAGMLIVPKEVVDKAGKDFGRQPVGTGPYKFREWVPNQRLVLIRNETYYEPGKPYIDRIEYQLGIEPQLALLRLERGDADVLHDGIPAADYASITRDPRWKPYIESTQRYLVDYLTMNIQLPPFDNVQVRRAVAMAVDKVRAAKLRQGSIPAKGYFAPTLPGYNPALRVPTYNPASAKALLAAAGFPNGFRTELYYVAEDPDHAPFAQVVQQDLAQIGIKVELRPLTRAALNGLVGKPKTVPMSFGTKGGNYADPFDFLSNALCATAGPGTITPDWYCNPKFDEMVNQAEAIWNNETERLKVYQQAEQLLVDDSSRVFLANPLLTTLRTPKLKGFYLHPVLWFQWKNYWLDR
jgi:ABC-type transport system substrate-binding protein